MRKLNKFVRSTIIALALLGFATGAVAVTHAPTFILADGGNGNMDAG